MEKLAISRKSALLVLWSGVALGLAACGGDGSDTAAAPAPTPVPAPTTSSIEQIQALLDQSTANIATDLPSAGEDRYASLDSCYLGNGETKAYKINQWNADPVGSKATQAYLIGQTISGLTLSDESTVTNTDGSETRFATAHYKVSLKDGTSYDDASTVVYGNSAAVAGCAEPSNMPAWRFIGNQRQINAGVRGNTYIYSYWNLSDGSRRTPSGQLRREVQFAVRDPMKIATYLIVSGPGPSPTGPMTLKLISPRILRDAPEMRGLRGNANFTDTDTFQRCWVDTAGTSLGTAATADCTTFGASGSSVGTRANAGTDAATWLVEHGWAVPAGATPQFAEAEQKARTRQAGLYAFAASSAN